MNSLRISSIHLENFKSWFGHHTIVLDPTKFTAIVGANGSGKSNIIDALLFVFGFRAKQLRQTKATDLIHFSHEQPDFARVQIDFVNLDQQFSVARVVRRSGQNYYEVNQQRASLEAVTQILLDNGLDINHNRFLILQGEVESISMMKPAGDDLLNQMTQQQLMNLQILRDLCDKLQLEFDPTNYFPLLQSVSQRIQEEHKQQFAKIVPIEQINQAEQGLLEFIESIVGTHEQVPKIAQQAALVEFILQVKSEIRTQLTQALQFRDQLNDVKDEAVAKIRKTSNEVIDQMSGLMFETSDNRAKIEAKQKENITVQLQLQELQQGQIQQLENDIIVVQNDIKKFEEEIQNQTAMQQEEEHKLKQMITQMKVLEEQVKHFEKEINETTKQQNECQKQIVELEEEFNQIPAKTQTINSQINSIQEQIKAKEDILSKQQAESDQNSQQTNAIKSAINELEKQLQPIATQRAQQQSRLEISRKQANSRLDTLVDQSLAVVGSMLKINNYYNYKNPKLQKLTQQKEELQIQVSKIDINKISHQHKDTADKLQSTVNELQQIDFKIQEINTQKQDNSKQSKLLNGIMQAVKQNILNGVYGRLGSLGTIDPQLNLAAIAAFSGQLDYIVCDNMQVIQKCLDYIREKQLGFASFIDLEQVTKRFNQSHSYSGGPSKCFFELGRRMKFII
ncbi:SMC4-like_protein [Hexamita inflata]|uniref:SMC4-like protein n=1 Tax=Hexamita inflata TaxID=28002 RepID=A0AA86NY00_9EUKA|nr:SMC4-like protein [Hexamita inflata]